MRYLIRCEHCGAECWCNGEEEWDTNSCTIEPEPDDWWDPLDKVQADCPHEEFKVIDSYSDYEVWAEHTYR